MYSLGVYTVLLDTKDEAHKYFCLATAGCRQKKTVVPCKGGDFPTRTRDFCALWTSMEKYPAYGYTVVKTRYFCEFCTASILYPILTAGSVRNSCAYPTLL